MPRVAKAKVVEVPAAGVEESKPVKAPTKRKSTPKKKTPPPPQPKVMHFNGVPYLTLEKQGAEGIYDVYSYKPSSDTSPLFLMGSFNSVSKEFVLKADWKEKIQDSLSAYRKALKEKAEDAMDKAYELQGVQNPKFAGQVEEVQDQEANEN
jgi:hypothetical protein